MLSRLPQLTKNQRRCLMSRVLKWELRWSTSVGWRWSKVSYIMWEILPKKGIEKMERENTVATKIIFIPNCDQFIQVWPPRTGGPLTSEPRIRVWLSFNLALAIVQLIRVGLVLRPTFYKFIVLNSLDQDPIRLGLGYQKRIPTYTMLNF